MTRVALELAVQDVDGVRVAARIGADRVELCAALATGGATPSAAFIEFAVAGTVPVHVLVRPRAGDFVYNDDEVRVIVRDVAWCVGAGAAGVVVGGTRGGAVDTALVQAVVAAAGDAQVTFHRAFDVVDDRMRALDVLAAAGVARVLTSGGAASAADGVDELTRLVRAAGSTVEVMAGGGVRPETVRPILAAGVPALHASAKRLSAGAGIALGSGADARAVTDEATARRLRASVDEWNTAASWPPKGRPVR